MLQVVEDRNARCLRAIEMTVARVDFELGFGVF
jgi:hypothetical protein